jgi:Flp pilus assembly protein TadG
VRGRARRVGGGRGQATVELALALPLVVLLVLAIVQVGLVVRASVLVTHVAREGARAAAVDADPGAARAAVVDASSLEPDRLAVAVRGRGGPGTDVTVTVSYLMVTDVPIVGALVGDVTLSASATMRVESSAGALAAHAAE